MKGSDFICNQESRFGGKVWGSFEEGFKGFKVRTEHSRVDVDGFKVAGVKLGFIGVCVGGRASGWTLGMKRSGAAVVHFQVEVWESSLSAGARRRVKPHKTAHTSPPTKKPSAPHEVKEEEPTSASPVSRCGSLGSKNSLPSSGMQPAQARMSRAGTHTRTYTRTLSHTHTHTHTHTIVTMTVTNMAVSIRISISGSVTTS